MKYTILSERVGTVGAAFDPPPGCNVQALIKARHIEATPERKPKTKKGS